MNYENMTLMLYLEYKAGTDWEDLQTFYNISDQNLLIQYLADGKDIYQTI